MILLSIHCDTIRETSDKGDDCGLKIDEPNNTMEIGPSTKELLATSPTEEKPKRQKEEACKT